MAQEYNLLYQRYRLIALVVYGAVLFAGLVDWIYGGLGPKTIIAAPEGLRFFIFVMAAIALIAIELWGVGKASFVDLNKVELFPFIVRLLLFIAACLITDLNYSQILFLPILLYAHLAVNQRLSYFMAVLGVAALFGLDAARIDFVRLPSPAGNVPLLAGELANRVPPKGSSLVDSSMGSLITLLFTLLLARAMSQAIQAQQKLTGLFVSLEASHAQLKRYSSRVADLAATEERNRLARDIHDSLGHHLAAINIQLEKANAYRARDPDRAYEAVKHAQHAVQDALKDVRKSVSSLRQEGNTFSFQTSLNDLIRRMHHSDLNISITQTGNSAHYSRLKLMTLYRAIQEGLTNVHKHAEASEVAIVLNFGDKTASLKLTDNGCGFKIVDWETRENDHHGLVGLQERLSLVGGSLVISSQPSATVLMISIPQTSSLIPLESGSIS